jgi:hypothetical protein
MEVHNMLQSQEQAFIAVCDAQTDSTEATHTNASASGRISVRDVLHQLCSVCTTEEELSVRETVVGQFREYKSWSFTHDVAHADIARQLLVNNIQSSLIKLLDADRVDQAVTELGRRLQTRIPRAPTRVDLGDVQQIFKLANQYWNFRHVELWRKQPHVVRDSQSGQEKEMERLVLDDRAHAAPPGLEKDEGLSHFQEASKSITFAQGLGIPGRVWDCKLMEVQYNVQELDKQVFLRREQAVVSGLYAALGVPVLSRLGEVLGVITGFLGVPLNVHDHALMKATMHNDAPMLHYVAQQVAAYLERAEHAGAA